MQMSYEEVHKLSDKLAEYQPKRRNSASSKNLKEWLLQQYLCLANLPHILCFTNTPVCVRGNDNSESDISLIDCIKYQRCHFVF